MLIKMTSRYHDSGILALGFSTAILIDGVSRLFSTSGAPVLHATVVRLLCGVVVGPLVVICLLLKATVPHRIVLALGILALSTYLALEFR
ncbi:MAG: hypothetical protein M3Y30_07270 [Gemmatimonadota bacterium]|nr:hypothetical protein [Gemmatimonadota bacterium]